MKIKMFITDVDGVLTDGGIYYTKTGAFMKRFNAKDGLAHDILKEHGVITVMLTGGISEIANARAKKLGFDECHTHQKYKLRKAKILMNKYKVDPKEVVFIGDEVVDIELLTYVGYPFCPADAHKEVKRICPNVCKTPGGQGVMREVVQTLQDNGLLE
jgi:YrbI family 3-deoxy-D-manno-octulosonate 8-phosphate phosphatase